MNVNGFVVDGIARELGRTEEIINAEPQRHTALRTAAKTLSRRGLAQAKAELANNALATLIDVLYESDGDGARSNVDVDGRILIPLPWGRRGCLQWGLRVGEANAFRWVMLRRVETHHPPLLSYDAASRVWLLNAGDYSTRKLALAYLNCRPITLAEWREGWAATRSQWARQNLDSK